MLNEFDGTDGWLCPCYLQSSGCGPQYTEANPCTVSGDEVRRAVWLIFIRDGGGCTRTVCTHTSTMLIVLHT